MEDERARTCVPGSAPFMGSGGLQTRAGVGGSGLTLVNLEVEDLSSTLLSLSWVTCSANRSSRTATLPQPSTSSIDTGSKVARAADMGVLGSAPLVLDAAASPKTSSLLPPALQSHLVQAGPAIQGSATNPICSHVSKNCCSCDSRVLCFHYGYAAMH